MPPKIQATRKVVPMIYAYTTPEIARHDGWTKIGYTEQLVEERLKQQTHTADVKYRLEWKGRAIFDDEFGGCFRDTDFHAYLRKQGIENDRRNEWFHVTGKKSKEFFDAFRTKRGVVETQPAMAGPYTLRPEQQAAVEQTVAYFAAHPGGEFLWNAKPRFGKTLTAYDLCKRLGAQRVLIVTNRPAIANSWYEDYTRFLGRESGLLFVSQVEGVKDRPGVLSREQYALHSLKEDEESWGCIEFVSLQDLKGSLYFGGEHDKLKEVADLAWDLLVIDEAHEGVDTYKTDVAFDQVRRKFTLHLSGTPFKALANDKFPGEAIYNWTYADEQRVKRDWVGLVGEENPYGKLPRLNLFTYQMSELVREELEQGVEIDGETEEFAFDLNLFFQTKNGQFLHEGAVDRFLDALTTQPKFPFSTPELREELRHTFWLLDRVDSAKALAKKLQSHPVFQEYEIVLAAGDGKLDELAETRKSFDRVRQAVETKEKSITLSVGQLTTGVTIPEWTAVLMLSNVHSPALYMQAAFRAQNPHLFEQAGTYRRKENAYVFDFDPARTLTIFEEFANDLSPDTADGRGELDSRKQNVRELLNFFPVIGEDPDGEMVELDAEQVLSIPRKIHSQEVVRRGFMSNFLFQNISNVFGAPGEVIAILNRFEPIKEKGELPSGAGKDLSLNEDGEIELEEDWVVGQSQTLFGEKIYDTTERAKQVIEQIAMEQRENQKEDPALEQLKRAFQTETVAPLMEVARTEYGRELKAPEQKRLERKLTQKAEQAIEKLYGKYKVERNKLEVEKKRQLEYCQDRAEAEQIQAEFTARQQEVETAFHGELTASVEPFVQSAGEEVVRTVETQKQEREKISIEEDIRDHLRGFSRTIPSFLMAYGDESVTLENFDTIIPDEVFRQVTNITLEQFRFLRDGGPIVDEETGEEKQFRGKLFEPVVFNDSVREFMALRRRLADYFEEGVTEDIFDYIPPQKNNQIFTPKRVVRQMIDLLEQESPGCFDDPDKTFADLYMKSGLYLAEIVKRLYRSPVLRERFPEREERLRHIFAHQVYGLAPTEIIYRIASNYVLGFDGGENITTHNLRQLDSLPHAKAGTLETQLEELFPSAKVTER